MKNTILLIATAVLLLSFGCKHDQPLSTGTNIPEFNSLAEYEAYYDSVYSVPPGTSEQLVTTVYLQNYPVTIEQVGDVIGTVLSADTLRGDSLTERGILPSPGYTVVPVDLDTLGINCTVLGITDVIFVWQGDTCTTALLEPYLMVFEGGELQCGASEGKAHVVFLMVAGLLCGNPAEGVIAANSYLSCVLPCTDLSGYTAYAKNSER